MFDLVIPCAYWHFNNLPRILEGFNHKHLLNKIIIVVNSIEYNSIDESILDKYKDKLILRKKKKKKSPGQSKAFAMKYTKSKYIVFHDADDDPHPDKLLILKHFFEKTNCDHILHLIQPQELDFLEYKNLNTIKHIDTEEIIDYYIGNDCNFGDIIGQRASQGLIAVKREKILKIGWIPDMSGEDKDFNLKSLLLGNRMILIDCYLSKYDKYDIKMMERKHPKGYIQFGKKLNKLIMGI